MHDLTSLVTSSVQPSVSATSPILNTMPSHHPRRHNAHRHDRISPKEIAEDPDFMVDPTSLPMSADDSGFRRRDVNQSNRRTFIFRTGYFLQINETVNVTYDASVRFRTIMAIVVCYHAFKDKYAEDCSGDKQPALIVGIDSNRCLCMHSNGTLYTKNVSRYNNTSWSDEWGDCLFHVRKVTNNPSYHFAYSWRYPKKTDRCKRCRSRRKCRRKCSRKYMIGVTKEGEVKTCRGNSTTHPNKTSFLNHPDPHPTKTTRAPTPSITYSPPITPLSTKSPMPPDNSRPSCESSSLVIGKKRRTNQRNHNLLSGLSTSCPGDLSITYRRRSPRRRNRRRPKNGLAHSSTR